MALRKMAHVLGNGLVWTAILVLASASAAADPHGHVIFNDEGCKDEVAFDPDTGPLGTTRTWSCQGEYPGDVPSASIFVNERGCTVTASATAGDVETSTSYCPPSD